MSERLSLPRREIEEPLRDLAAWVRCLESSEIPVLPATAESLEAMRLHEDDTDANLIGEMVARDPLMTLKVIAFESEHRSRRVVTSAETVTSALVMMGISPFFRAFGPQRTVDEWLSARPEALEGLHRVIDRADRGANFALAFAIHRADPDAAVIHAASLLHEFAEMLIWCHAPSLALKIQAAQAMDPQLRSATAQRSFLNVELAELQRELTAAWHLPALLADVSSTHPSARNMSVRTVSLAARLARHSTHGWENAAIPDDIADVAALLNLSPDAALAFVQDI